MDVASYAWDRVSSRSRFPGTECGRGYNQHVPVVRKPTFHGRLSWVGILPGFAMALLVPGFSGAWQAAGAWLWYAMTCLKLRRTALRAATILGLLIAGWHLPLIVVGDRLSSIYILQIMGAVITGQIHNAEGSVLIIMLSHAMDTPPEHPHLKVVA